MIAANTREEPNMKLQLWIAIILDRPAFHNARKRGETAQRFGRCLEFKPPHAYRDGPSGGLAPD
jgi:hypothetical protein